MDPAVMTLEDARGRLAPIVWSPDGRALAYVTTDGSVVAWDVDRGAALLREAGAAGGANGIAWAPRGRRLGWFAEGGGIRAWDAVAGPRPRVPPPSTAGALDWAWSPDGEAIAISAEEGFRVRRVDAEEEVVGPPGLTAPASNVLAWSPDGAAGGRARARWGRRGARSTRGLAPHAGTSSSALRPSRGRRTRAPWPWRRTAPR